MPVSPNELFQAFNQHFGQFVPDLAKSAQDDVQQQMKAMLMSLIAKLDLVTREEFDVQTEVLRRTREKMEALEARVKTLEESLPQSKS